MPPVWIPWVNVGNVLSGTKQYRNPSPGVVLVDWPSTGLVAQGIPKLAVPPPWFCKATTWPDGEMISISRSPR